jgi:hypothetical protein
VDRYILKHLFVAALPAILLSSIVLAVFIYVCWEWVR